MLCLSGSIVARTAWHAVRFGFAASAAVAGLLMGGRPAHAASAREPVAVDAAGPTSTFTSPLPTPLVVLQGFEPPAKPWLPGSRGVNLAAASAMPVLAAASGVVLYAGELAGRGVVSIDHGGAMRTTYEPVDPTVRQGEQVTRGEVIGYVSSAADHCGPPGSCLHWGAILAGSYVDPMKLLRQRPPVRLLPIWSNGVPGSVPDSHGGGASEAMPHEQPGRAGNGGSDARAGTRGAGDTSTAGAPPARRPVPEALAVGSAVGIAGAAVALGIRPARRTGTLR